MTQDQIVSLSAQLIPSSNTFFQAAACESLQITNNTDEKSLRRTI